MTYLYDGTFEGLLSVIFETYRLGCPATAIEDTSTYQPRLFEQTMQVNTRMDWSERVLEGMRKRSSRCLKKWMLSCWLSEKPEVSMQLHHLVRRTTAENRPVWKDFRDDNILALHQTKKQMNREVHRMHAFVRFQCLKDDLYVATVNPDFNVLPLIGAHFEKRYPALRWLIFDTCRQYGLLYENGQSSFVRQTDKNEPLRFLTSDSLHRDELSFQQLWRSYFEHTNIPERQNLKLHEQHVPRRYWKYLPEKLG